MAAAAITAALVVAPAFVPLAAHAVSVRQEVNNQFTNAANVAGAGQQSASFELVVVRIVRATFGVIGVVLVGFMVYAGWIWMTAGDESDKIERAKSTIRNAIIGLIILTLAYAISRFVIVRLLQATGNVL